MNDDRKPESEERSWLDRLTHFISGEPQNKTDLEGVLSLAEEHEIIDEDARKIMEGALLVTDMQVRDIMIPRAQMIVIDSDQPLQEALPKIVQSATRATRSLVMVSTMSSACCSPRTCCR